MYSASPFKWGFDWVSAGWSSWKARSHWKAWVWFMDASSRLRVAVEPLR